jgi:hypothetical protein
MAVFGSSLPAHGELQLVRMEVSHAPALSYQYQPHIRHSGTWGWNFGVSTVLRLGTQGDQPGAGGRDFICMGSEGGRPEGWANRWSLWIKGNYSDAAQMVPEYAGVADWGES